MATSGLDHRVKRIFDHLYANASVRTPSAISTEVGKLLQAGIHLERSTGRGHAFDLSPDLRSKARQGETESVRTVAEIVRTAYEELTSGSLTNGDARFQLNDHDIAWCAAELDGVSISDARRDVIGDAVEIFRTSWAKQHSGQFFTDGRVTHLAMVLLSFDPLGGDDFVDASCGTGGFLLAAMDRVREQLENRGATSDDDLTRMVGAQLHGQDVDPEIVDVANASLRARLIPPFPEVVQRGDSLNPESFKGRSSAIREGTHLCAATNPPFGTKITVKDRYVLADYELTTRVGRSGKARVTPLPPDILLLEKNLRLLKPGVGRLAIVLPYQILSGPQTRYIREWLLLNAHLEAVIDLPPETFQPHTGTKTSLVVFRRRRSPLKSLKANQNSNVFASAPQWIGHDRRGNPTFRRNEDGSETDQILSDFDSVETAFELFKNGEQFEHVHDKSIVVQLNAIIRDPDLRMNAKYYLDGQSVERRFNQLQDWKRIPLGELVDRIFFPTSFKRNYVPPGEAAVPFLGGANITQLLASTDKWLRADDPRMDDLVVKTGWLLVTRSGSTGIVSAVPPEWNGFAISEHVIRIVPKTEERNSGWIFAYLRSDLGRRALARGIFGSVIDEITPEFLAELEIPVPVDPHVVLEVENAYTQASIARSQAIAGFERTTEIVNEMIKSGQACP